MAVMSGPYRPGTPCWTDLMVPDQQAAIDFYCDLFGWQGEVGPAEFGGYAVCSLKGKPVAGIMKAMNPDGSTPDPMPPSAWTTYLSSTDADATVKAGTAAGGKTVMGAQDVGDLGRMAILSDPTGAVFGIWQPKEFPGAGIVNENGAVTWNELATSDTDKAGAYYRAILPLDTAPTEVPGAEGYTEFKVNNRSVGGMMDLSQHPEGTPPHWLTYFLVDDADSTQAAAVRAGGNVLAPAFDMPVGRMAVLQDPQGAVFAVIKTSDAPQDPDPM